MNDVSGNKPGERLLPGLAAANDGGRDSNHRTQFLGGGVGPGFLGETQTDPEGDHHGHDSSGAGIPRCKGNGRECGEEQHERVKTCVEEQSKASVLFVCRHGVGSVLLESGRGLLIGETRERTVEPFKSRRRLALGEFDEKGRDLNAGGRTLGSARKVAG